MKHSVSLIQQPTWRVIDHSALGPDFQAIQSFAIDDTLCHVVGTGLSPSTARAWMHHKTIVLGIQDSKLPHLRDGISYLENKGYKVLVRNSGGLAVVLDSGILNISLIFTELGKRIDINKGYDAMVELIKCMFKDFDVNIEAREIEGSYCPGSYDLSIEGKKFAGISQRRIRGGVAVQIYLCINGSGSERATTVKEFYNRALAGEKTKFHYPIIIPEVMASLSELLKAQLTVESVWSRCLEVLREKSEKLEVSTDVSEQEKQYYDTYLKRMQERNGKITI